MRAPRFTLARALAVLGALAALLAAAWCVAVLLGEQPISWERVWQQDTTDAAIFWSLRVPRVSLAALVGAALAAAGATLQGLTRNPLADPFVLGVSGGAALGATLSLALGLGAAGASGALGVLGPSSLALVGALGATFVVLAMGRAAGARGTHAVLLAGVIFNSFALAAVTLIKTLAAPDKLGEILYWLAGAIGYEKGSTLMVAGAVVAGALASMWLFSGRLNLLMLGDEDAASLGVAVGPTRLFLLLCASLAVAVAVSLAGLVGFVGLIVPHLLRMALGPDQRLLVPASALGGATFLVLADLGARLLFWVFHREPPVGVVTALLGGPFFLLLMRRPVR